MIDRIPTLYVYASLQRNERCIYITGDVETSVVMQQIRNLSESMDVSGDLIILDKSEIYSKNGKFSPDKLIAMIRNLVETATNDGYSALSITGELSWVLDYEDGQDLIIEYEWKLNEYIFDQYPVSALCRYNQSKFPDSLIRNIIQLHPIILWKTESMKIHIIFLQKDSKRKI
ncbi:MAG TPA: hypothetical protein DHN33_10285 [Eubacteriaceae bacterium]|nr:hypothetical protein [Eubacteriaceae bacterium]